MGVSVSAASLHRESTDLYRVHDLIFTSVVFNSFASAGAFMHRAHPQRADLCTNCNSSLFTIDLLRLLGLSPVLRMASRWALPSDPEYLLDLISDLPDESDSSDDFEGYLDPEDGPVA